MSEEKGKILELSHVSREFELRSGERLRAVADVSLSVGQGECVFVVGESGCGKSTLVKLAARMETLTSGKILFEGEDVTSLRERELRWYRRRVQIVLQDPGSVCSPWMKTGRFLMEPWINFEKKTRREAREMALYSLERVGLPKEYFGKYPHQLSGGEMQRVAIARAIALHPRLLICDEATSALDVSVQRQILDLLREHQRETGYGVLFVCHDLAVAEDLGDKVAVMYLGHVVEIMTGSSLRRQAAHPYTRALLDSVLSVCADRREPLHILPGEPPSPVNLPEGCVFCSRCRHAEEICARKMPELMSLGEGHWAACWRTAPVSDPVPAG